MTSDLKNGTLVAFELTSEIRGRGAIRGIASTGTPVLGKTYIVEYSELSIPWDYSCITVFESQFKPLN